MSNKAREGFAKSVRLEEDDVEGHALKAREGYRAKATEDDVEGHALKAREGYRAKATEDDVEGHSMLPNDPGTARQLAAARESEIRRHLARHEFESEARRPHKRDR